MQLVKIGYSKKYFRSQFESEELSVELAETPGQNVGVNSLFDMAKAMCDENALRMGLPLSKTDLPAPAQKAFIAPVSQAPQYAQRYQAPPQAQQQTFGTPSPQAPKKEWYMYVFMDKVAVGHAWNVIKSKKYPGLRIEDSDEGLGAKKIFSRVPVVELAQWFKAAWNKQNPHM